MKPQLALTFVFITVLLDSIGFGIIMPVLPQLIMDITGDPLSSAAKLGGGLMFVYAVMQFFTSPILGNLSDRFGRRPILLGSLILMGMDYLLMGWAPTIGWLFLGRIIAGISASTYGIANAFIADTFEPEQRAQNFGLMGAAFGVGFIVGPVIGGVLGEYGPRVPFYAAAILAFANATYGYFVLPETLKLENRRTFELKRANPIGAVRQLGKYSVVLGLVFAMFFYQVGHHSLPSIWSYYSIEKFDWTPRQIGMSLGFVGLLMVFVQAYLIRKVIPRYGPERCAYFGMVATILSFIGYAFVPVGWAVYVVMVVGSAQGFVTPAIQGIMSSKIPADSQGELQGGLGSMASLASIVSPPFMTQLFGAFAADGAAVYFPGAPFLAAAVFTLIALYLVMRALSGHGKTVSAAR